MRSALVANGSRIVSQHVVILQHSNGGSNDLFCCCHSLFWVTVGWFLQPYLFSCLALTNTCFIRWPTLTAEKSFMIWNVPPTKVFTPYTSRLLSMWDSSPTRMMARRHSLRLYTFFSSHFFIITTQMWWVKLLHIYKILKEKNLLSASSFLLQRPKNPNFSMAVL